MVGSSPNPRSLELISIVLSPKKPIKRKEGDNSANVGGSSPAKRHREASLDRPLVGLTVQGVNGLLNQVQALRAQIEDLVDNIISFKDQIITF